MASRRWANEIQSILELERANGGPFWSRQDGNIHAPAGFATLLVLNVLGELGATSKSDPLIKRAVEFVFGYQTDDGAFRYSPTSSLLPCISGQALAGLGRLGVAGDQRAVAGYRRLLEDQQGDGGWRCPKAKLGRSQTTDASNPGTTLFVLDAFRFRRNTRSEEDALGAGVESLLRHWETRTPLGPCAFGIGTRFLSVEYPFWRYNIFYYVYVLSHYRMARRDKRFLDAAGQLRAHVSDDGEMIVDTPPRDWQGYPFARRGQPSELATERWRQIQANLSS
jgi:hypothetical protein